MATAVTSRHGKEEVVRPLRELASLIKTKLKEANEAAEEATRPYWKEIGELLVEAKGQFDTASEFYEWTKRQFDFGETQSRRYIDAVPAATIHRHGGGNSTLSEALRSIGKSPRGHHGLAPRDPNDWRPKIDDIANRARREAERIRDAELTRQQEREADRQLALRLIDIGYKILAKELHPDAGGSKEAMSRLHTVRDRLKAHA